MPEAESTRRARARLRDRIEVGTPREPEANGMTLMHGGPARY